MKLIISTVVFVLLYVSGISQLNDTAALIYKIKPSYQLARRHKITGNTLTAVGFAGLGIGALFGMATIIEAKKEIDTYPLNLTGNVFGSDGQLIQSNPEKYLYPAIGILGVSIPLLVIGKMERKKAKLGFYAARQEQMVVKSASLGQGTSIGMTLAISL